MSISRFSQPRKSARHIALVVAIYVPETIDELTFLDGNRRAHVTGMPNKQPPDGVHRRRRGQVHGSRLIA